MMAMLRQYPREGTGHAQIILGEKREETISSTSWRRTTLIST